MKRYSKHGVYNPMADINVIPLMDLTFCLLIIFMMATPLLEHSLSVKLPQASNAPPLKDKATYNISIEKTGRVFLNKNMVGNLDELKDTMTRLARANPEAVVLVRADEGVAYAEFVKVVDTLKAANIQKLGIVTTPQKQSPVRRR
jgi:biopolymer transport protein ExbD